jgi:hypothetical protein
LICGVCRTESFGSAKGWRAFQGREDDDTVSIVVFRPDCMSRELELDEP